MSDVEIVARVERRRKWTIEEKAALIAEVEAEGGKVSWSPGGTGSRYSLRVFGQVGSTGRVLELLNSGPNA